MACGPVDESLVDRDLRDDEDPTDEAGSSGAGASSGRNGSSGGSSGSSGGGSSGSSGSSGSATCTEACGDNSRCSPATNECRCLAGFTDDGAGACVQAPTGTPASHTEAEVCARWAEGHRTTAADNGWTAGGAQCSPGSLSREAIDDAVSRINMFRWLEGLAPAVDDEAGHAQAMACATVGSWNPPGTVPNPHTPPATATCYTQEGAFGASSSNMAWGSRSAANAMDQWVEDRGNETTLGHRRWILNPALGRTAIGYYAGGGPYGDASCMSTFDGSGTGPRADWYAFPPEGYAPVDTIGWIWSVTVSVGNANQGTLTVVRESDGATLGFTKLPLLDGYGYGSTVGFAPQGWQPSAGEIYRATFVYGGTTLTWNVTAAGC